MHEEIMNVSNNCYFSISEGMGNLIASDPRYSINNTSLFIVLSKYFRKVLYYFNESLKKLCFGKMKKYRLKSKSH